MKKVKNNLSKLGIFLTCLTLSVVLGTSAFAAGLLDPLFSYFRSDEEVYLEEILAPAESISNEKIQIRLEGAIADENTCYMVVSLIGFSASEKKQIEKADIHNEIEIYGLFEDGERVMGARKSAATYAQGKKAKSLFPDATRTSVIAYTPKACGISDVEKVCFSYGGLVLEVLPENYLTECYKMASGINQNISDIQLSRVGFSFTQSISGESEPDEFVYDISLIRDDGTVLTAEEMRRIGYSHDFSMRADLGETKIAGNWGQIPTITILDLDDYSGLQINGENYYYEKKDCGAVGSGTFVNGYSVKLKSAQTDGFAGQIILGITGPDGSNLLNPNIENYDIGPGNWGNGFITGVTSDAGHSYSGGIVEDGDGLPNTVDYKIRFDFQTEDGSPTLTEKSVMRICFEDIWGSYWDYEAVGFKRQLIAEGVWSFDVSFEGVDLREIELISTPIYAKGTTGWSQDGKDTAEDVAITSFKLRSMSVDLTSTMPSADFSVFNGNQMQVVMKDGEKIPIIVRMYFDPIDLDQVDYVLFPDGTKLPVPVAAHQ